MDAVADAAAEDRPVRVYRLLTEALQRIPRLRESLPEADFFRRCAESVARVTESRTTAFYPPGVDLPTDASGDGGEHAMVVPIQSRGHEVLLVRVTGKESPYDDRDRESVALLGNQVWLVAELHRHPGGSGTSGQDAMGGAESRSGGGGTAERPDSGEPPEPTRDEVAADARLRLLRQMERKMVSQALSIREKERSLLARELHDQVGQTLTAIRMDLALMDPQDGNDAFTSSGDHPNGEPQPGTLASVRRLVDRSIQMIQEIAVRMREPILDDMGLVPALTSYLREFEVRSGLRCILRTEDFHDPLNPEVGVAAFRIAQEALTNAVRHSRASRIIVTLTRDSDRMLVEIADDGVGIRPEAATVPTSLGIAGMRERAAEVGGSVEVAPGPDRGTVVLCDFPLISKPFARVEASA